ncbi:hypothetical protein [Pedobacter rhizosphaerae]|uniref:DUF4252 domain-containing protein n=1 Tax=Pedobacter rhizosphaerae TaxID=390241 RepID=A0A1H9PLK7_9SPHI|nr:hypothetical protein [Pedobacter rhizosphaerae]SER48695.1 hypothetical protein SAMN04488023_1105 [Pedobacter rhizosphaerae]
MIKMKLITFLLILISTVYSTHAQEINDNSRNIAVGPLPSSIQKVTYSEIADLKNYYGQIYFDEIPAYQIFRDGKILVSLIDMGTKIKKLQQPLEKVQIQRDARLKKSKYADFENSEIITVNQTRYLVTRFQSHGNELISISSAYNSLDQQVYGIIEFKSSDKKRANEILNEILHAIHLKK